MKRGVILVTLLILAAASGFLLASPVAGLPDYAVRTGEPCATCHINPAGGGPRTPRGLAWVAAGKPEKVPELVESLPTPEPSPQAQPSAIPPQVTEPSPAPTSVPTPMEEQSASCGSPF